MDFVPTAPRRLPVPAPVSTMSEHCMARVWSPGYLAQLPQMIVLNLSGQCRQHCQRFKAVVFPEKAQWGNRSSLTLLPCPPVTGLGDLATLSQKVHLVWLTSPSLPSHGTSSHLPGSTYACHLKVETPKGRRMSLVPSHSKSPRSSVVSSSVAVDPWLQVLSEPPKRSQGHCVRITLKTSAAHGTFLIH